MNGTILYEGPSLLDGKPIVCIATGNSKNAKTGDMIQTWILRQDIPPNEAVKTGNDASICGDCKHRGDGSGAGRSCYVTVWQAPLGVFRAYTRGAYSRDFKPGDFEGKLVRLGAYGDPAAVPLGVLDGVVTGVKGHTGYTHAWQYCAPEYKEFCMASCDSDEEYYAAKATGWRTFRVKLPGTSGRLDGEALCPASAEAGFKLTCNECLACCGTKTGRRGGIVIDLHGSGPVIAAGKRNLCQST